MWGRLLEGVRNPRIGLVYALESPRRWRLNRRGTPLFRADWDALVLLDGCRHDAIESIGDDHPVLQAAHEVSPRISVASTSHQWMERTFAAEFEADMARTGYVTANPFTADFIDADRFAAVDEVWRYAWDDEIGTIRPGPVTDRAIEMGRSHHPARLIVHYMQPHFPPLSAPELGSRIDPARNRPVDGESVWEKLEQGTIERDELWALYMENLRTVLDSLAVLLRNLPYADVAITADHGNGFGEAGIYGHPGYRTHWSVREVPWVRTTASDEETHEPARYDRRDEGDLAEKLSALGYR